jgi:PKD repeat protein
MTILRNSFNNGVDGVSVTTDNGISSGDAFTTTSVGSGGAITYSNLHPAFGPMGIHLFVASVATWVENNNLSGTNWRRSMYFYLPTVGVTWQLYMVRTSVGQGFGITLSSSGKLQAVDSAGVVVPGTLATTALAANTMYRIDVQGVSSATVGNVTFQYYTLSGGVETLVQSLSPTTPNTVNTRGGSFTTERTGRLGTTGAADIFLDSCVTGDDNTTPFGAWTYPSASFTTTPTNLVVAFNASASTAISPATISTYAWTFGDTGTGTGVSPSHTYAANGTYTVVLTVTDSAGKTITATKSITLSAPVASFGAVNCTIALNTTDSADKPFGTQCLQMTSIASGDMSAMEFHTSKQLVDVGKTYTFLASFRAATTARSCAVGVLWYDYLGNLLSGQGTGTFGTTVTDTAANNFTPAFLTIVAPAGAQYANLVVEVLATAAGEVHKVDKCSFSQGTSTSWMPGGYVNDQSDVLVERGERVDDTRGKADNWAHPQVASAGTLLQTYNAGFEWTAAVEKIAWNWLDKAISAPGYTPAGMIVWAPLTAVATEFIFGSTTNFPGAAIGPQIDYLFPVLANQVHIFSLWAWVDTGTLSITPEILWRDQTQLILSRSQSSAVTLTTTPQLISFSATAPADSVFASGAMKNTALTISQHIFFTRIGWGLGTIPVDGKMPRGGPLIWTPVRFPYSGSVAQQSLGDPPAKSTGQREKFADFDVTPDRPLVYRASVAYTTSGGVVINSLYSTYQTVMVPAPPVTLLRSATNPALQVAVNRRKQSTFTHVEDAQIFHPPGSDGAPVRIRDWVGGEDGQLILITSTEAQYARLIQLITASDVLILQWAQGGRTYCLITDRSMDETISMDADWCDVDGISTWAKYAIHSLTYVQTVAP